MNVYLYEAIEKEDIRAVTTDRATDLLERMRAKGYNALPVVEDGVFLGMVLEDQLQHTDDAPLALLGIPYAQACLHQERHIFDALTLFRDFEGNIMPLVAEENQYTGHITSQGLLKAVQAVLDTGKEGCVLIIEAGQQDHALSYMAHILESTDTRILSLLSRDIPGSDQMEITLKLSVTDPSDAIAALCHHDYVIKSAFHTEIDRSGIQARYEHLMNYINM